MPRRRTNDDEAVQVALALASGAKIGEIAESWRVTVSTLRVALKHAPEHLLPPKRTLTLSGHVIAANESGTPPELYAWRAGISFPSLRRAAWADNTPLLMNTYAERMAFWVKQLETFLPYEMWPGIHNLPIEQIAHWYHKINNPEHCLLWGHGQVLIVQDTGAGRRFFNLDQWADAGTEAGCCLGVGKKVVRVSARIAREVSRFTTPLN